MDQANLFETPTTYRLLRAEFGLGAAAAAGLLVANRKKLRWKSAMALFVYPDLVGYLPGALAYRRSADRRISPAYYVLYNTAHSFLTGAAIAGLWVRKVRPEWALLVIPMHLAGDRSLFGNFMKQFSVDFEPAPHPVYAGVRDLLHKPAGESPAPAELAHGAESSAYELQPDLAGAGRRPTPQEL